MLNCKLLKIIIGFCGLLAFSGCLESKYNFDINIDSTLNEHAGTFLKELPGINGKEYLNATVSPPDKVEIYKASMRAVAVEKDNLLEVTEQFESREHLQESLLEVDGAIQDLYMLKYKFKCTFKDGTDFNVNAVVYFSLHYKPMPTPPYLYCTGHGLVYWGTVYEKNISFDSLITIKKQSGNGYYLDIDRSKNNNKQFGSLIFSPVDFPENPEKNKKTAGVTIKKIIRTSANRIGGGKPLIFDLPVIFKDDEAIHLYYIKTVSLNK